MAADSDLFGFISYVRFDDDHNDKQILKLRNALASEIRAQTGRAVHLFLDRDDLRWGDNWKARIEQSLSATTILIPIMTPSYFMSAACREEFEIFHEREKALKRDDLIWPIYYIGTPLLDVRGRAATDGMAKVLASRHRSDWRELRLTSLKSVKARRELIRLAQVIRDRLEAQQEPTPNETSPATSHTGQAGSAVGGQDSPLLEVHAAELDTRTANLGIAKAALGLPDAPHGTTHSAPGPS